MTTQSQNTGESVHRLVDMVVEEVSLVDRAANKHRFLIVKRDDTMEDDATTTPAADSPSVPTEKLDDGTPLGAALTALESLTELVEALDSLGAGETDGRLASLAEELRGVAETLLERTMTDEEKAARAKKCASKPAVADEFTTTLTSTKQTLQRVADFVAKVQPAIHETHSAPANVLEKQATHSVVPESFAQLVDSFRLLSDSVKEQHHRLGRVEKQFGLPNSAAPAEQLPSATSEDVGWPLDLNKPKDRESVDKAISFHDL